MGIVGFWLCCYLFCREDVRKPLLLWCCSIFCYWFVYDGWFLGFVLIRRWLELLVKEPEWKAELGGFEIVAPYLF